MAEIEIGALGEMGEDDHRVVEIDGIEVGIFRLGETVVAWRNECPHYGGPVCQGRIFNQTEELLGSDQTSEGLRFSAQRNIVCPWHGYEFNLETGCHPGDPTVRLARVDTTVRDGRIFLRLPGSG